MFVELLSVLAIVGGIVFMASGVLSGSTIDLLAGIGCFCFAGAAGVWRVAELLQNAQRAAEKANRRPAAGEAPLYELLEQR